VRGHVDGRESAALLIYLPLLLPRLSSAWRRWRKEENSHRSWLEIRFSAALVTPARLTCPTSVMLADTSGEYIRTRVRDRISRVRIVDGSRDLYEREREREHLAISRARRLLVT